MKVVEFAQLCLTLCDPMDYTVHGILQAKMVEWIAVPYSRGSFQPMQFMPSYSFKVISYSHPCLSLSIRYAIFLTVALMLAQTVNKLPEM